MSNKIDKRHWIIQGTVLFIVSLLLLFLPKILNMEALFETSGPKLLYIFPTLFIILCTILSISFKKGNKIFTKSWLLTDFTYWNIFAFFLSLIAILRFLNNFPVYGIFTQIFAYIALFLGYANELRNEIMKEKVKKK